MKRIVFLLVAGLWLAPWQAEAATAMADTAHDLSASSTGAQATSETEICKFCHTPHNANTGESIPLWNRATQTWALSWGTGATTLLGTALTGFNAESATAMCLTCHDGATSVGAIANGGPIAMNAAGNVTAAGLMTGDALVDNSNMAGNHPVSIPYAGETYAGRTSSAALANGYNAANTTYTYTSGGEGVECGSCHQPHDEGTVGADYPFLRTSNSGSALCTVCHNK